MAVSMNSIGNYTAYGLNSERSNKSNVKNALLLQGESINTDEKKFFAEMYPAKQTEIMEYYYYEKSGRMNGISVGTNIDRKG
ncbi:MAG: hypothetical protein Q8M94_17285 [Ignavibacteria bacterium]|nr:hypothetical protein [Ignavibacteria bacterium]